MINQLYYKFDYHQFKNYYVGQFWMVGIIITLW